MGFYVASELLYKMLKNSSSFSGDDKPTTSNSSSGMLQFHSQVPSTQTLLQLKVVRETVESGTDTTNDEQGSQEKSDGKLLLVSEKEFLSSPMTSQNSNRKFQVTQSTCIQFINRLTDFPQEPHISKMPVRKQL